MPEIHRFYGIVIKMELDASRTVVFWNSEIDLPSDTIYEYGKSEK